jgi:hypothetical protein
MWIHPMRDGSHGGSYVSCLPNGSVLGEQKPATG